jgi:N-acetyl-gamma-glutamyl-phosphate reductase
MPVRVAIVGATGYAGGELARLLLRHPEARLVAAVARGRQGEPLRDVQPHLHAAPASLVVGADPGDAEVVFTALPAGEAAKLAPAWLAEGRAVIDIGSDFRLRDPKDYERWYAYTHPAPQLLKEAVYGLTELTRDRLRAARVVANPGCYPAASLLALAPALRANLVEDDIIIDAKSGVSGAGHNVDDAYLFGTIDESVRPYGVPKHRHTPEIAQEVRGISGRAPRLTFTPHLVPMTRGLIATCYATLREGVSGGRVAEAYATAYAEEPFIRVTSSYPATKATLGSNWWLVHAVVDEPN